MKKILIGFALGIATLSFAQQYPNGSWNDNNNGYYENDGGYYSDQDDQNYFPDDYYYDYPQDYYPQDYYMTNYNDYRSSIINIDWNVFFAQNRLNRWQVDQIMRLNNLYVNFTTWNNFYRYNPDRWYYDRFYALQRIMGPRVFVVFQNNYYRGYSPVVYFQNYRRTHYGAICRPMPRYRNVNINIYRVDRARFRRADNPTFNIVRGNDRPNNGFRGGVREGNGGFRSKNENRNPVFRNDNPGIRNNSGGFRGSNGSGGMKPEGTRENGGFRTERAERTENNGNRGDGFGGGEVRREEAPRRENNGGGFRNDGGFRRSESQPQREQNRGGGENRGNGGFRNGFAKN
ncbi:hypothetical protein [Chryseobacterium hagamense]|uniref:DUF3300 domain-containing protein n=1 Tax=Chryseobacterium hagamense TaxID=395935 RepID=A0A511YIU4_9FLAO|nr:hypothetical protein [Chryseobacterium hagamense]GEN75120.1 hypothetical protein CHA01nite_08600 [Chryseobacterium hagamense]